jgi:hypothetical protein
MISFNKMGQNNVLSHWLQFWLQFRKRLRIGAG